MKISNKVHKFIQINFHNFKNKTRQKNYRQKSYSNQAFKMTQFSSETAAHMENCPILYDSITIFLFYPKKKWHKWSNNSITNDNKEKNIYSITTTDRRAQLRLSDFVIVKQEMREKKEKS